MAKVIYIVVPCYNEEEVLHETAKRLNIKIGQLINKGMIANTSKVIFVDDGSKDNTWQIIEELHEKNSRFGGIKLSSNRGHQNALFAGLMEVKEYADAVISIDADLQDDIEVMDEMINKYLVGNDIVYAVRSARETDTIFKRFTAETFYKVMKYLGANIVFNHADYRLMSKRALEGLGKFKEVNLFLRGLVPMVGYQFDIVTYERAERFAGKSKYPLKKMLFFAFEGITSLTTKPIKLITLLGTTIFGISIIMVIYSFIRYLNGQVVQGWTSMAISIWALGGIQLISIGVIGEYIGKIYLETKGRPRYIIEKFLCEVDEHRKGQE